MVSSPYKLHMMYEDQETYLHITGFEEDFYCQQRLRTTVQCSLGQPEIHPDYLINPDFYRYTKCHFKVETLRHGSGLCFKSESNDSYRSTQKKEQTMFDNVKLISTLNNTAKVKKIYFIKIFKLEKMYRI